MISDNNSAHIQRQNGDFSGLRDKVIRLHTQFELVTKGGPEALERTLAVISKASSSLPLAVEKKQTDDGKIGRSQVCVGCDRIFQDILSNTSIRADS